VDGANRKDEIGALAGVTEVFKENTIRADCLAAEQAAEQEAKARRAQQVAEMTQCFEAKVGQSVGPFSSAATQMEATAGSMSATAEQTNQQSATVAAASEETSANVQTVAAATEEPKSSLPPSRKSVGKWPNRRRLRVPVDREH
jgi:methyl-accepting chemotaxis protein